MGTPVEDIRLIETGDPSNRGRGRCMFFGNVFKFSRGPFFIEGLYVGNMN